MFHRETLFLEALHIHAQRVLNEHRDTNLQLSFPPSTWVLFSDQNELTRSQGELFGTSSGVGSNNLGNF